MLNSNGGQDDGDEGEYCQNVKTEQDRDQFLLLSQTDGGVEVPGAHQQGEDDGGHGGDEPGRGWDGECGDDGGDEAAGYSNERAGVGGLLRADCLIGEVEAEEEVEEEGDGGGELVASPGHCQPALTPHTQHLQDAGQGEGGVEGDQVGGGDEVPVVSVEEDRAECGETGEENITDGGVAR